MPLKNLISGLGRRGTGQQRDRETERQRDRDTERQTERQRDRETRPNPLRDQGDSRKALPPADLVDLQWFA